MRRDLTKHEKSLKTHKQKVKERRCPVRIYALKAWLKKKRSNSDFNVILLLL
jgi:hypothetical protein